MKRGESLTVGQQVVGARVESRIGARTVTDFILCTPDEGATYALPALDLSFTGRFGIVRVEEDGGKRRISLYIGAGTDLRYGGHAIRAVDAGGAYGTWTLGAD